MGKMILGRKIGQTQVFAEDGERTHVTVVQVGPMTVIGKKSESGPDGYAAIKVGFEDADKQEKDGEVRYRGLTAAEVGVFTKAGIDTPKRHVREFRVSEDELENYEVGQEIDHSLFEIGDYVDVTATSKGRGFAGVMKRHNFRGFKASHGVHESYRGGGSTWRRPTRHASSRARRWQAARRQEEHRAEPADPRDRRRRQRLPDHGRDPGRNGALVTIKNAAKRS